MRGITPRREQGMADPVLAEMVHATGATESRHHATVKPVIQAYRAGWVKLASKPGRKPPIPSLYDRLRERRGYTEALEKWFTASYLPLMKEKGLEGRDRVKLILGS